MSEQVAQKKEKDNKKGLLIVVIIAAVLIIAGLVTVIVLLLNEEGSDSPVDKNLLDGQIRYEQNIIAVDEDDLQAAFDAELQKIKDGYITVNFNNWAESTDGKNFKCYIGNSYENKYDAYFNIYLDSSFSKQVLLTGLIPPGSGIDTFTSEIELEPGEYEAILVLTQVDDDHKTIHAQTNVVITLVVKG